MPKKISKTTRSRKVVKGFEYKIKIVEDNPIAEKEHLEEYFTKVLNEFGSEGWEAYHGPVYSPVGIIFFFKRIL